MYRNNFLLFLFIYAAPIGIHAATNDGGSATAASLVSTQELLNAVLAGKGINSKAELEPFRNRFSGKFIEIQGTIKDVVKKTDGVNVYMQEIQVAHPDGTTQSLFGIAIPAALTEKKIMPGSTVIIHATITGAMIGGIKWMKTGVQDQYPFPQFMVSSIDVIEDVGTTIQVNLSSQWEKLQPDRKPDMKAVVSEFKGARIMGVKDRSDPPVRLADGSWQFPLLGTKVTVKGTRPEERPWGVVLVVDPSLSATLEKDHPEFFMGTKGVYYIDYEAKIIDIEELEFSGRKYRKIYTKVISLTPIRINH